MSRAILVLNKDREKEIVSKNFEHLTKKENVIFIDKKYETTALAINNAIKKAKEADPNVEFIHIFHDDVIINETFSIEKYEKFVTEFDLGYYFNPRLSDNNYIFNLLSPRLIIDTKKYADANINVFAFDSSEYLLINCKKNNELFSEDLSILYNLEYIYRCKKANIIPFLNFYFDDSSFNDDMIRDNKNFPKKPQDRNLYMKEEELLSKKYNVDWTADSNADAVIEYFKKIKGL